MAETDLHRLLMTRILQILEKWFAKKNQVYVSGNLLIYYVPNNKRRHVAPDVFVVFGVPKKPRDYYLTWKERKYPRVIIEITSSSTKADDQGKKFTLYRDVFKVREYFLFDPRGDYLDPVLQGYRLSKGEFTPIPLANGRMESKELGLLLEANDDTLNLIDPLTGLALTDPEERAQEAEESIRELQAENERLRRELHGLRRRNGRS